MKFILVVSVTLFLTACATKFVFSESAGHISGWNKDGYFNVLDDKRIRFDVNNSYTMKSSEVFFWLESLQKSIDFQNSPAFSRKPFIITAFFETETPIAFEKNYRLILGNKTYSPSKVIVGHRDKNIYSCLTDTQLISESKNFVIEGNQQCMIFLFDFSVPAPDQNFNLMLVWTDGKVKSNLDVSFSNQQRESISTH